MNVGDIAVLKPYGCIINVYTTSHLYDSSVVHKYVFDSEDHTLTVMVLNTAVMDIGSTYALVITDKGVGWINVIYITELL